MADDSASIPPRVRELIIDHIDSVMQLEVLLLIASQPQRAWTASDLAELLRIDPAWVDSQLRAMAVGGLVAGHADPAPGFSFAPRSAELSQAVDELAKTYADRRVTVIGLIFAKPIEKIRSFADAFRIRKEKTD